MQLFGENKSTCVQCGFLEGKKGFEPKVLKLRYFINISVLAFFSFFIYLFLFLTVSLAV